MNGTDVQQMGLDGSRGVLIGQKQNRDLLRFSGDGHIMIFAPTGAGKGIGFVQPNLAEYRGSMVVLDPKGENAVRSAAARRALGQKVVILDPFGKTGLKSDAYNPLGPLSYASDDSLGPMIEALADAIIPTHEHDREPHWPMGAKRFLSFLLWFMVAHVPPEERSLVKLFELAYSGYPKLEKIAQALSKGLHSDPGIRRNCIAMGNWFFGREHKEFSYFESQAQNYLGWVGDSVWPRQLAGPPSPPLPFKSEAITVFLVLPFQRLERYRPWLRLLVTDFLNSLYDAPGSLGPNQEPVLFMLDEAAVGLGNLGILETATAAVRSAGARICMVYQDMPQAKKCFPKSWSTLLANSGVSLYWAVNELETAKLISESCGQKTAMVPGQPAGAPELLIRPEAVMRLPSDEILALFRSSHPARFGRLNVLQDPRFSSKLDLSRKAENSVSLPPVSSQAPRGFVPLSLDEPEYLEDKETKALSSEFGRRVVKDGSGRFGYLDERGVFVPLKLS